MDILDRVFPRDVTAFIDDGNALLGIISSQDAPPLQLTCQWRFKTG